jgi:hypothetical protein
LSAKKEFVASTPIKITPDQSREEIIKCLSLIRHSTTTSPPLFGGGREGVDLAFYAARHMDSCDWKPFYKAAFERNPVSIEHFHDMDLPGIYNQLLSWPDESIYDGNRLALPDEVVNFQRGDGIEKAITLANILKNRHIQKISIDQHDGDVILRAGQQKFIFQTLKELKIQPLD